MSCVCVVVVMGVCFECVLYYIVYALFEFMCVFRDVHVSDCFVFRVWNAISMSEVTTHWSMSWCVVSVVLCHVFDVACSMILFLLFN